MQDSSASAEREARETTSREGLSDVLPHAVLKSIWKLGKTGTKNLLKSDTTKRAAAKYIKNMSGRMIGQSVSQSLDNLASKIPTLGSGLIGGNSILPPKKQEKD